MIKLICLSIFFSYAAVAGLPPTSTQGSAGGGYKTTFQFNFPYIPITQSGTNASFGQIPLATGVSGNLPLANIASIANLTILSNVSGGSSTPSANSISAVLDAAACSTQGSILYRNGSGAWVCLSPGTSGHFLQTQGTGSNPTWAASEGSGAWTGYTPIFTNMGSASSVNFEWRQSGPDTIDIRGSANIASGGSGSAGQISLPNSYTVAGSGRKICGSHGLTLLASGHNYTMATAGNAYLTIANGDSAGGAGTDLAGSWTSGSTFYIDCTAVRVQ